MKIRDVLAPAAAVLLLFAGYFKANPLLRGLPADLTVTAAAMTLAGIAVVFVTSNGLIPRPALPVLALWATFVPGAFLAGINDYAAEKADRLFTLTFLSALAPAYLVTSKSRQQVWVWLHVVVGVLVVVLARVTPAVDATERFLLEGSNTIAAGRATGAALVVALVLLIRRDAPRWFTLSLVVAMAAPLVASGSRGPVLAAIVAVLLVSATAPSRSRTRAMRLLLSLSALGAGVALLAERSAGSARIEKVLIEDPLADNSLAQRSALWQESIGLSGRTPEGVGWGDLIDVQRYSGISASGSTQYAHNVILETLVEGGWWAGIATLLFVVFALRRLRHAATDGYSATLYGLALFFAVNAMVSGDINDNRMMWAALAFGWVLTAEPLRGVEPRTHTAAQATSTATAVR